jgi:hypothetical protein
MFCKAKFAVCSEIHTKQIPRDHNEEFFNVKLLNLLVSFPVGLQRLIVSHHDTTGASNELTRGVLARCL